MRKTLLYMAITGITLLPFFTNTGSAQVYQTVENTYDLETAPIDITSSMDGKYTYVLAEGGKIFIFSEAGEMLEITVDATMDHIFTSGMGDKIYLSSQKSKKMQEIFIDFQQNIDIEGSPFLGDEKGAVIIAAFSDFQ